MRNTTSKIGCSVTAWITFSFIIAIISVFVRALPTGAPVCTLGVAAPGNPHTSAGRSPQTGPLAIAGFIVKIGDVILDTNTPITVQAYQDLRVVVTSEGGEQPFRGALVIVSKPGIPILNAFSLTTNDETKLQSQNATCAPLNADGVTHVDNEIKTSVEATLNFDQNIQELLLDVNVVVVNRIVSNGGSFYYYSQYKINVEGATSSPTLAPIRGGIGGGSGCGLLGLGIFCPTSFCGFFGRLLLGDRDC